MSLWLAKQMLAQKMRNLALIVSLKGFAGLKLKMSRGSYDSLLKMDAYNDSKKAWVIELQRSDMYWYDLIVNPTEEFNSRRDIIKQLKAYKEDVESQLEKRFIYFICSRKKVRFNAESGYSYDIKTKAVVFYLLLGKDKQEVMVRFPFISPETDKPICPVLEISSKFITFVFESGKREVVSIHDFLAGAGVNLGIETEVQYIGYTKNPDSRPINGSHEGLNRVLYNTPNDENDIFIYFNLFKVMVKAEGNEKDIEFLVPNSMTDEVDVNTEGLTIEKVLILYFKPIGQKVNLSNEDKEISNILLSMKEKHKVHSVHLYYEIDDTSEYWTFNSDSIPNSKSHVLTAEIKNNKLSLIKGSTYFSEI